jgi:hypothetical protein
MFSTGNYQISVRRTSDYPGPPGCVVIWHLSVAGYLGRRGNLLFVRASFHLPKTSIRHLSLSHFRSLSHSVFLSLTLYLSLSLPVAPVIIVKKTDLASLLPRVKAAFLRTFFLSLPQLWLQLTFKTYLLLFSLFWCAMRLQAARVAGNARGNWLKS